MLHTINTLTHTLFQELHPFSPLKSTILLCECRMTSQEESNSDNLMQEVRMNTAEEDAYPSAYTAPAHPRPQAEPNHSVRGRQEERGDLTADNLERIPDADHVAPGIRLQATGNDAEVGDDRWEGDAAPARQEPESVDRIKIDGRGRLDTESESQNRTKPEVNIVVGSGNDLMMLDSDRNGESFVSGRAPSSVDYSGRSSTGAIDHEGSEGQSYRHDDGVEEDLEDFDDEDDDKDVVHERVGGSGATAENASKGTSVGHFGPRGEAIRECFSCAIASVHCLKVFFFHYSRCTTTS